MRWFGPAGLLFIPVSPAGWLITALAFAFCAHTASATASRRYVSTRLL